MRSSSAVIDGFQVFAVAGTNSVSFGVSASDAARTHLLGFAVKRIYTPGKPGHYLYGMKKFPPPPAAPGTKAPVATVPDKGVSTHDYPVQALVWDDFTCDGDSTYTYLFEPLRGTPDKIDRTAKPIPITITTEPIWGQTHDVFFNRGVASSQAYVNEFQNVAPDKQPTPAKQKAAYAWLTRDLEPAVLKFISNAKEGDALRCAFYEFAYGPVLDAFKAAIDRGVDVRIVVDEKNNKARDPLSENLKAIAASGLPASAIKPRVARTSNIAHNKFMVLLPGGGAPTEVWSGSTNLTDNGFFGQANVGHWVRDAGVAKAFLAYWTELDTDPGGLDTDPATVVTQKNAAFYKEVATLTPSPALDAIGSGVTPIFSPRSGLAPLDLYAELVAKSKTLACATFPFDVGKQFTSLLADDNANSPLVFFLLDSIDSNGNTGATKPAYHLSAKNNVYEAVGSEIKTTLGDWAVEVNARNFGMAVNVVYIHCKFLLHDPLGDDPIVVTGSANFSEASTSGNDENMMIIRGDKRVADIYFTEFNRLFFHYYFRYIATITANDPPADGSISLTPDSSWLNGYAAGTMKTKRVEQFITMKP
jgi:phosphatidylserine/phosphatidylglycerophosphate/cardiolipin synthase-like enzyme